jgi:AcrR family transcriptional regulator
MSRRDQILEAALRVFAETGFRGATTRRIAQEAEVNEVTLFRHFPTKEELITAAIEQDMALHPPPALPVPPRDPEAELTAWCRQTLDHLSRKKAFIRKYMAELHEYPQVLGCMHKKQHGMIQHLIDYLEALKQQGWTAVDFDVAAAMQMLRGTVFSDAMSRDMVPMLLAQPPERAAAEYARLFLRAIGVAVHG